MTQRHLLTGSGSGIGAVVAARLHARGDRLVHVVRSAERAEDLGEVYPGSDFVIADLADPASLSAAWEASPASATGEGFDSVLHSAGVVHVAPAADLPVTAWQEQAAVNLIAPAELTRLALPALRQAKGTIVFVNSGSGIDAKPGWSSYAASKFGLRALADALRSEEAEHGVRVTSVYPGRVATPMQELVHAQEKADYDPDRWIAAETVADVILQAIDAGPDAVLSDLRIRVR